MTYRYRESYPFLALARRHGLRYEDVLAAVTFLEGNLVGKYIECPVSEEAFPLAAMQELADLVDMPVAERGGREDYCTFCKKFHPGGDTCMGHYP